MSTTRRFSMFDLLKFNNVNLDPLTETYNMSFYTQYLAKWPEYCFNVTAAQGRPMGYILGKAEGLAEEWHGHVTAVTVPPEYRRLGVAAQLMNMLERGSENDKGYFVDLFVRQHGQSAPLAGPQLAFCATSGRTGWLGAACTPRGRGQPTGRPATASGARASGLQRGRFHRL
jgi:GNAT superfamily N-acetyltransferase